MPVCWCILIVRHDGMFSLWTALLFWVEDGRNCEESLPLPITTGTASKPSIDGPAEGFMTIVWFHLWEDVWVIGIRVFCSQQELPWYIGLTERRQLAMAPASAAACDFWCTGDKSFPQMPTSRWHLALSNLSYPISINGHTTLAHHDNWGQAWTTAWGQNQRQAGVGGGGRLG